MFAHKFVMIRIILLTFILIFFDSTFAQQGCCSHHDGTTDKCDLDTGRIICKDGKISPSCLCTNDLKPTTLKYDNNSCLCPLDNDQYGNLCGKRSIYFMSKGKISTCYPTATN